MKVSAKNICSALLLCPLLLGSHQAWSSDKKKRKNPEEEQKVYAKKVKTVQDELKEMESSLSGLAEQMRSFDVDLREKDFRNLVLSIEKELNQDLERLEKLSVSADDKKRVKETIAAAKQALTVMIRNWGIRQAKLAEEREKLLLAEERKESLDLVPTGSF